MFKAINLEIRFLLELVILIGYWGFHFDSNVNRYILIKYNQGID